MIYIRLFHGRTDPNQNMDDWGTDGPVFGPYEFAHTTYSYHLKLGNADDNVQELFMYEDMLYYDGVYYGDWTVFGPEILDEDRYPLTPFEQEKANLPR
jgi:hypothetical protein